MNLYSAINQALHIALETDPRCVSLLRFFVFWFVIPVVLIKSSVILCCFFRKWLWFFL